MQLKPDTQFSGKCPSCGKWCHYKPLPGPGAYAPRLDYMTVTCLRCSGKVLLTADLGQSVLQPLIVAGRGELDLTKLNAHITEWHAGGKSHIRGRSAPRKLTERSSWHWGQHHRVGHAHLHFGPIVLVRDTRGSTLGQIARPIGWFTGQEVKTKDQLNEEFRAAHGGG